MAKIYFGEWEDTLKDEYVLQTPADALRRALYTYVTDKVSASQNEEKKRIQLTNKNKKQAA